MFRAPTERLKRVAGAFIDWGIGTADAIRYCQEVAPNLPIIASGGLKTGIDVAKSIALGAQIGGLAGEFLKSADQGGTAGAVELANALTDELRITMFCAGVEDLTELAALELHERNR
jgi:isopentenyl-diphosphate delta-isomerase